MWSISDAENSDAQVWRYIFKPGLDFTLEVRGQIIGRVHRNDTLPPAATARWFWTITCGRQFVGMTRPSKIVSGYAETKAEAVEALRATWALERDWRAEMWALTPYHDAGMSCWVGLTAWETYGRPATAELAIPGEVGRGRGLDATKPWEIY